MTKVHEVTCSNPPAQAGQPRADCSWLCPDCFWTSPRRETIQHLWPISQSHCSEEVFPDIKRQPPMLQFGPIVSSPVPGHRWKEPPSYLHHSFKYLCAWMRCPWVSLPWVKKSQLSQPVLIWEVYWSFKHLCSPLMDCLQYVHVCLVWGSPELGTILLV